MSIHAAHGVPLAGPADSRRAFLKKTAALSFVALVASAVVATASTYFAAPVVYGVGGGFGGMIAILGSFFVAHYVARKMVYGASKLPGLVLAVVMEGFSIGFLLLTTILKLGAFEGFGLIAQCMGLTGATAGGMLLYVWFNKSELNLVKAGLSMLGLPMLILMGLSWAFPLGGAFGLIISVVFVVVSAAGLLYRLNAVVHEMDEDMHVEAAYEITMGVLILFWNLLVLLNRVRR
jgi:FtsH-binding integral membrane protein